MKRSLYSTLFAAAIVLTFFSVGVLHAQFLRPFHAAAGVGTATEEAHSRLGSDAVLILIGAVGEFDASGMPIRFHRDNGESDAWAYVFYSPSTKQHETIPVIDIMGDGMMVVDDPTAIAIPKELTTPLDLTLPFAGSDRMIERITTDSTYQRYHRELPDVLPQTISCRTLLADDSLILPKSFPLDAPAWVLTYTGGEDSMMLCYISCRTGQTFSLRAEAAASVEAPIDARTSMQITAIVTSADRIRVTVTSAQEQPVTDPPHIILFDVTGQRIAAPVMELPHGNTWIVEFDASVLPYGRYFCRITGNGWDRTISIAR
jgi:hypothetical protein